MLPPAWTGHSPWNSAMAAPAPRAMAAADSSARAKVARPDLSRRLCAAPPDDPAELLSQCRREAEQLRRYPMRISAPWRKSSRATSQQPERRVS